jgi:hypothetical protein
MLVEKIFMLCPARIHGSCHRLQKKLRQIAGQSVQRESEVPISLGKLVPPARFQRATFRLGGGRSMQLSYGSTRDTNVNREGPNVKFQRERSIVLFKIALASERITDT